MNTDTEKPAAIDWRERVERILDSGTLPKDEPENKPDHDCIFGWKPTQAYAILVKRGGVWTKERAMRYVNRAFFRPCPICAARAFLKAHHAESMTWQDFDFSGTAGPCAEYLRTWTPRTVDQFALIHGREAESHNGKTHALIACAHALILAGQSARFFNAADLYIEDRFNPDMDYLGDFKGWLFIDDLGKENNNAAYRESLDRALDKRWRSFVPTVISTKLYTDALKQRYPRFMDRMQGGTEIEWAAESYRRAA